MGPSARRFRDPKTKTLDRRESCSNESPTRPTIPTAKRKNIACTTRHGSCASVRNG